ncbi:MAG: hypothetical protein GF411_00130 [Candidatus Lokiarchaeota archaeon]|nr:hypothetical protein [Candidatus Lokiarchaeota archaeon]
MSGGLYYQGAIVKVQLDIGIGSEINGKIRPCIVLAVPTKQEGRHSGESGLVIIVPLTSTDLKFWTVVRIKKRTGLDNESYALCHQIRSISSERIVEKSGKIDPYTFKIIHMTVGRMLSNRM